MTPFYSQVNMIPSCSEGTAYRAIIGFIERDFWGIFNADILLKIN